MAMTEFPRPCQGTGVRRRGWSYRKPNGIESFTNRACETQVLPMMQHAWHGRITRLGGCREPRRRGLRPLWRPSTLLPCSKIAHDGRMAIIYRFPYRGRRVDHGWIFVFFRNSGVQEQSSVVLPLSLGVDDRGPKATSSPLCAALLANSGNVRGSARPKEKGVPNVSLERAHSLSAIEG
jgi:hypothetical protein